jgi:beta-aspartyl-peptidase (threonine type)
MCSQMTGPAIIVHGGAGDWPEGAEAAVRACERAVEAGAKLLSGGSAVDAVVAAVRVLEDDPACNAGTGATLTAECTLELDACVMDGATMRSGAVACLPPFRNPIDVARSVLDDGRYHLLAADGAARFAVTRGFVPADPASMALPERRAEVERLRKGAHAGNTVGAVALDGEGRLAAATSTGGIAGTEPGRVGDSPIVGAGTYANGRAACSCTGDGEAFARMCAAFQAVEDAGENPQASAALVLDKVKAEQSALGGLIVLNRSGAVGVARTMRLMPHAVLRLGADLVSDV